jgi:dethiobiotin synthetase
MTKKTYFISGIDTDCGKTYVTGHLAASLLKKGYKTITQKPVQTGCFNRADDIIEHRRLMGISLTTCDINALTCSYLFKTPASPHLAAAIEGVSINTEAIAINTQILQKNWDIVLIEGAGGLMVPFNENEYVIDYIKANNYPLILVSSSKLGSINHTLMSIECILNRNIILHSVIYNRFENHSPTIANDSFNVIEKFLHKHSPQTQVVDFKTSDDLNSFLL